MHRPLVILFGIVLVFGSIGGLIGIGYKRSHEEIGAYIDFIIPQNCIISGIQVGPLLGPGTESRIKDDALLWISNNCQAFRMESSRRFNIASVNGVYLITETEKGSNFFDTWKYDVILKNSPNLYNTPLIVEVLKIGKSVSFASWTIDLSVRPASLNLSANGSSNASLQMVIPSNGEDSKDILVTYVNERDLMISQILTIVLSALIGVGASALFQGILSNK